MENPATIVLGTVETKPMNPDVYTRRYTEAEIAQLEAGDLTDLTVLCALRTAYEQNDPAEAKFRGIQRDPPTVGSEATLRARLASADAVLKQNPKDCQTRKRRLNALSGLACLRKYKELAESAA